MDESAGASSAQRRKELFPLLPAACSAAPRRCHEVGLSGDCCVSCTARFTAFVVWRASRAFMIRADSGPESSAGAAASAVAVGVGAE